MEITIQPNTSDERLFHMTAAHLYATLLDNASRRDAVSEEGMLVLARKALNGASALVVGIRETRP